MAEKICDLYLLSSLLLHLFPYLSPSLLQQKDVCIMFSLLARAKKRKEIKRSMQGVVVIESDEVHGKRERETREERREGDVADE